jgi:hypothetical protein
MVGVSDAAIDGAEVDTARGLMGAYTFRTPVGVYDIDGIPLAYRLVGTVGLASPAAYALVGNLIGHPFSLLAALLAGLLYLYLSFPTQLLLGQAKFLS